MVLEFRVNKQHLSRVDKYKVVEKSENYLWIHFTFSNDWSGLKKYLLAKPLTTVGNKYNYKYQLDENGRCQIPYDLSVFPGFMVSVVGIAKDDDLDFTNDIKITTDYQVVDVSEVLITNGCDATPIRFVTSNNRTINIFKKLDFLDIGLETEFEYVDNTLYLYAITHYKGEKVRTVLSSIELATGGIAGVTTELEYTDPETGITTYRNLVFTTSDGQTLRVSLDYFWDEIREQLDSAVENLNLRIDNEVSALDERINTLSEQVIELSGSVNELKEQVNQVSSDLEQEIQDRQEAIDNLQTQVTIETIRAQEVEEELSNKVDNLDNAIQEEHDRALTQEVILSARADALEDDVNDYSFKNIGNQDIIDVVDSAKNNIWGE